MHASPGLTNNRAVPARDRCAAEWGHEVAAANDQHPAHRGSEAVLHIATKEAARVRYGVKSGNSMMSASRPLCPS